MIDKNILFEFLDEVFPHAHCELNYSKDYEFLIAVMLSAQTTDKSVNKATIILFSKFPTLEDIANADIAEIENCIYFLGMYKNKAKNLKQIASILHNQFNDKVPCNELDLLSLPGVGNKTKNCIMSELFKVPYVTVDTHVQRVSKRLKICNKNDSVVDIENKLNKLIPKERILKTNHQLIWFGRYLCKALNPKCEECKLKKYCGEKAVLKNRNCQQF